MGGFGQSCVARTRVCCSALSLRRTGDDLHASLHKGFKIRLGYVTGVYFYNNFALINPSYWIYVHILLKTNYPLSFQ